MHRLLLLLLFTLLACGSAGAAEPGLPEGLAWVRELAAEADCSPVLAGERLLVRSGGNLLAFRAADGAPLWSTPVAGEGEVLVAGGVALASGCALDLATGRPLWNASVNPGSPQVRDGRAWGIEEGQVVSRDLRSGEVRFRLAQIAAVQEFRLHGRQVVFTTSEQVGAWDLDAGRLDWSLKQGLSAVPFAGGVLVLDRSGRLQVVDSAGRPVRQAPDLYGEMLVLGPGLVAAMTKNDDALQILDERLRVLWKRSGFYGLEGLSDLGGDRLFLSREYGAAELLEARTGRVLRRLQDVPTGLPVVLQGLVHVLGGSGTLYRLEASSGHLRRGIRDLVPSGWVQNRPGTVGGGRAFLVWGGSLVAVGPGPGLRHVAEPPELVLTVPSPQVPGSASLTVHGRFTRAVALQVFRLVGQAPQGPPVTSRLVPLPAGYETQERSFRLPLSRPGTYQVTARSGPATAQAVLTSTGLGLTAKLAPEKMLVQVQDVSNGRPVAGVDVAVFRAGRRLSRGRSDANGAAVLPAPAADGGELVVMAAWKGQQIRFPFTPEAQDWQHSIFLETDRPIYRPGHTVHFRGVAMRDRAGDLQVASGVEVDLEIRDSADNLLSKRPLQADEAGTFSGDLVLAVEPPLGRYRLSARATGSSRSFERTFEVQEYRKPPFQVEVKPELPLVIGARPLVFQVQATRWFGGPVPGATLRWQLERQRLYGGPLGPDEEEGYRGYREFVSDGNATLDQAGMVTLRLDVPAPTEDDFAYTLQVDVAGPEGREVPGSARVLAARGEFVIAVSPRSWLARPGQSARLDVATRDLLGRGHSAQVRLDFQEERWNDGDWDLVSRGTTTVRTGADGRGEASWTPAVAGYFRIEATARDAAGRVLKGHTWVWVPGAGDMAYDWPSLKLIPERRSAKPGERLRVLVLADRPGTLLWTVEGVRLFDHRAVPMTGPATVVEVPIRSEHAPEIHLQATLVDRDEPTTASVRISVPDATHEVQVELAPDRQDYRPGGTAQIGISTTRGGRPVAAHLSVALVDEAIFALKEDQAGSIHRFFYGGRQNRVQTFHLMPMRPYAAGFQTVQAAARVRSEFQDTAFWSAHVLTGPDGRGRLSVPLPDDLTRWRATARAVAPPDGVGQTVASLVTRLPLMVQVIAPRFFVAGDRSDVLAVVHNRTEGPMEVQVGLQADGASLSPGRGQVAVAAGESGRDSARIEVGQAPEVLLKAQARAAQESDAEQIRVPVIPRGVRRNLHRAAVAQGPVTWDLEIPSGASRGVLQVRVDGSVAGVVTGALGYLMGFPYGCVEQTMSRFLPTVVASGAMERMGRSDPARRAELRPMVTAGLQKLYGYQHTDGGWGWWETDPTHPFMTGYVVMGLARAREAGWEVADPVLQRGVEAAARLLADEQDPEVRAWLAWCLTEAGHPPAETLASLAETAKAQALSTYSRALLTLALVRSAAPGPAPEAARLLAGTLKSEAQVDPEGTHWQAKSPTPYGWMDDDVEASALVVRALQEALGPQEPLVAQGVDWLVLQRRGTAWKSTRDTAQAVLTLSRYLEARGATGEAGPVEVAWNGQVLGVVDPQRLEPRPIELAEVPSGRHRVEIRPSAGAPLASALLTWFEPPGLTGESHGLSVNRRYLDAAGQPVSPLAVRAGEALTVELSVTAPQDMEYAILEDPRAAGVEPVPEEREPGQGHAGCDRREDRDERTVFFFTSLAKGTTTVTYTVRAETPGRFTALPARVELMYRPEVWGLSSLGELEVR